MFAASIVWLVVTSTPASLRVSPAARLRVPIVIDARGSPSASVNRKSDTANGRAVSSFVVALLGCATGASLTAMTFRVMVAATVPLAESFALKVKDERLAPLAFEAGE